ncbi:hypothetical protein ACJIZ3_005653 [Penstemon smallii]|uniref:Uncharacterized protein n=1 Tax=Penstemon smallii TaxID=265156 RepID=A0ABD3S5X0_9LAMI
MEGRRRQNWDYRRSKNKKPPRGSSQPTVPKWEKQFCKVIGSLDWEKILYLKKTIYLYEDVINWDDSAGEEAFSNAKKRFWAQINGLSCDISLPNPDLYIDEINWDSEINPELNSDNLETENEICHTVENHDPVIIFGDSLLPNQEYATIGWGDTEDNLHQVAANHVDDPWGNSGHNWAENGWPVYSNNGYVTCEGGWNDDNWGWNYDSNNNFEHAGGVEANRYMSSYGTSMVHGHDHYRHDISKNNYEGRHEMTYVEEQSNRDQKRVPNSFDSCARINRYAAMTVGQKWNR